MSSQWTTPAFYILEQEGGDHQHQHHHNNIIKSSTLIKNIVDIGSFAAEQLERCPFHLFFPFHLSIYFAPISIFSYFYQHQPSFYSCKAFLSSYLICDFFYIFQLIISIFQEAFFCLSPNQFVGNICFFLSVIYVLFHLFHQHCVHLFFIHQQLINHSLPLSELHRHLNASTVDVIICIISTHHEFSVNC